MDRPLAVVVTAARPEPRRLREKLERVGATARVVEGPEEAARILASIDVALLLGPVGEHPSLEALAAAHPEVVFVLFVDGDRAAGIEAATHAFSYVDLSVDGILCEVVLRGALAHRRVLAELRERVSGREADPWQGLGAEVESVRRRLESFAAAEGWILLLGEPGTGKEVAARWIHRQAGREDREFRRIDGALRPESALLARIDEDLSGGPTLFIRRLSALPDAARARLDALAADASPPWIIGTDSGQADALASESWWRHFADRVVTLPALCGRRRDIEVLSERFVDEICRLNRIAPLSLSPEVRTLLMNYDWPGNIRELRTAIEHAVILNRGSTIVPDDLPLSVRQAVTPGTSAGEFTRFREAKRSLVNAFERRYFEGLLRLHRGNVTAAAEQAGMLRSALQRLLRKHDIRSSDFRQARREKRLRTDS